MTDDKVEDLLFIPANGDVEKTVISGSLEREVGGENGSPHRTSSASSTESENLI